LTFQFNLDLKSKWLWTPVKNRLETAGVHVFCVLFNSMSYKNIITHIKHITIGRFGGRKVTYWTAVPKVGGGGGRFPGWTRIFMLSVCFVIDVLKRTKQSGLTETQRGIAVALPAWSASPPLCCISFAMLFY